MNKKKIKTNKKFFFNRNPYCNYDDNILKNIKRTILHENALIKENNQKIICYILLIALSVLNLSGLISFSFTITSMIITTFFISAILFIKIHTNGGFWNKLFLFKSTLSRGVTFINKIPLNVRRIWNNMKKIRSEYQMTNKKKQITLKDSNKKKRTGFIKLTFNIITTIITLPLLCFIVCKSSLFDNNIYCGGDDLWNIPQNKKTIEPAPTGGLATALTIRQTPGVWAVSQPIKNSLMRGPSIIETAISLGRSTSVTQQRSFSSSTPTTPFSPFADSWAYNIRSKLWVNQKHPGETLSSYSGLSTTKLFLPDAPDAAAVDAYAWEKLLRTGKLKKMPKSERVKHLMLYYQILSYQLAITHYENISVGVGNVNNYVLGHIPIKTRALMRAMTPHAAHRDPHRGVFEGFAELQRLRALFKANPQFFNDQDSQYMLVSQGMEKFSGLGDFCKLQRINGRLVVVWSQHIARYLEADMFGAKQKILKFYDDLNKHAPFLLYQNNGQPIDISLLMVIPKAMEKELRWFFNRCNAALLSKYPGFIGTTVFDCLYKEDYIIPTVDASFDEDFMNAYGNNALDAQRVLNTSNEFAQQALMCKKKGSRNARAYYKTIIKAMSNRAKFVLAHTPDE